MQKFWGGSGQSPVKAASPGNQEQIGSTQAEIADFLTAEPPPMEGHRGLEPVPIQPAGSATELGLRRSAEEMVNRPKSRTEPTQGVSEHIAKSLGSPKK